MANRTGMVELDQNFFVFSTLKLIEPGPPLQVSSMYVNPLLKGHQIRVKQADKKFGPFGFILASRATLGELFFLFKANYLKVLNFKFAVSPILNSIILNSEMLFTSSFHEFEALNVA